MSDLLAIVTPPVRPEGLKRWTEQFGRAAAVADELRRQGFGDEGPGWMGNARWFGRGVLSVCINLEPILEGDRLGWHLSISAPTRYPTWDEIKRARYDLIPHEVWMVQVLPPPSSYVNEHPNCFHLWESPEAVGLSELRGDRA